HTTMTVPERLSPYLRELDATTTWMQMLPAKGKLYRHYFLLYPFAVESARLESYDLIVSSCCGYAKGVKRGEDSVHVCYCHNPMRWVWRFPEYVKRENFSQPVKAGLRIMVEALKHWEMRAARRPDYFVANSHIVAKRLKDAFGVDATVIEPPIVTSRFWISREVKDYYLILARLNAYKRIDLAVEACTRTGRRLLVVGDGPERERLKAMAGPTVRFLGRQSDAAVDRLASRCRALIFPGEEDFGMAPLEINAAGRPVAAYAAGGATETVIDGMNGVLFGEQTVDSLIGGLERLEQQSWDSAAIRRNARRYDIQVFQERLFDYLYQVSPAVRNLYLLRRRAG
ncbi:MAG: glycosyltransferase, partial [Terracidiphilus sp.]